MGWSSHETLGAIVKMSVPFFRDTDVSFLILYSKGLFVFMQCNLSKNRDKKTYFLPKVRAKIGLNVSRYSDEKLMAYQ